MKTITNIITFLILVISLNSFGALNYTNGWGNQSCRPCEEGMHKDENVCVETTYSAVFSTIQDPNLQSCAGSQIVYASLESCVRDYDGNMSDLIFCSDKEVPQQAFFSPAERIVSNILYGTKTIECGYGQTMDQASVEILCDEGYSEISGECILSNLDIGFKLSLNSLIKPLNLSLIGIKMKEEDSFSYIDPQSEQVTFSVLKGSEIFPILEYNNQQRYVFSLADENENPVTSPIQITQSKNYFINISCSQGYQVSFNLSECVESPPPVFVTISQNNSVVDYVRAGKGGNWGVAFQYVFMNNNPQISMSGTVSIKRYFSEFGQYEPGVTQPQNHAQSQMTINGSNFTLNHPRDRSDNVVQKYVFVFYGTNLLTGSSITNSMLVIFQSTDGGVNFSITHNGPVVSGDMSEVP